MFKRFTIHLTEHLCDCDDKRKYDWEIDLSNPSLSMILQCKNCATTLIIPGEKLLARIEVEKQTFPTIL